MKYWRPLQISLMGSSMAMLRLIADQPCAQ
jgi:hypothetical protein